MKQTIKILLTAGVFALGLATTLQTQAAVVIAGTRVIYRGGDTEQTVKLTNEGKSPALTQIWLDKGDPKASPSAVEVPFTITPPLARIDPGKGQTLRILHTGEALPQDRESVFWLNVLEVPPKVAASDADANHLQMAFRSRVKMFYRPAGLKGRAEEAPAQISWRVVQADGRPALEARNPTPYHVSFSTLEVIDAGKTVRSEDSGMVNPGETQTFPLSGAVSQGAGTTVRYRAINDFGGVIEGDAALNAAQAK
jgi:fimbrial chaperone protein/chaperone protein EcpD